MIIPFKNSNIGEGICWSSDSCLELENWFLSVNGETAFFMQWWSCLWAPRVLPLGLAFQEQTEENSLFSCSGHSWKWWPGQWSHISKQKCRFDTWLSKWGRLHSFFRNVQTHLRLNTFLQYSVTYKQNMERDFKILKFQIFFWFSQFQNITRAKKWHKIWIHRWLFPRIIITLILIGNKFIVAPLYSAVIQLHVSRQFNSIF